MRATMSDEEPLAIRARERGAAANSPRLVEYKVSSAAGAPASTKCT